MRAVLLYITVGLFALGITASTASAEESTGPDAFASLLLVENHYGPGPDDGELLDLWLNHINETDPGLLSEPVCYAPIDWNWPEFYATTSYSAGDEYGEWEVECELSGIMDMDKLVTIDGVDYPFIASIGVFYTINWYGEDGSSFATAWGYDLVDVPPVASPSSDLFTENLPDGLPGDRLTYSLHLDGKNKVDNNLDGIYYYTNTINPEFPESDYEFETEGESIRSIQFDLIMYYTE